jgi:hypothetical protein
VLLVNAKQRVTAAWVQSTIVAAFMMMFSVRHRSELSDGGGRGLGLH